MTTRDAPEIGLTRWWRRARFGPIVAVLAAAALAPAGAQAADPNLMAQWHLDAGDFGGGAALDSSGHANHLIAPPGLTKIPDGRFAGAVSFADLDLLYGNAAASLEPERLSVVAWVRGTSPGTAKYLIGKGRDVACTGASYALETDFSGGLVFYIWDGAGLVVKSPDAGTGIWDGHWHAVAGTFDGSRVRLYVDGAPVPGAVVTKKQISYAMTGGNDLTVGGTACAEALGFPGDLDEVRIYDRALSDEEVARLHDPAATSPPDLSAPGSGGAGPAPSGSAAGGGATAAGAPVAAMAKAPAGALVAKGVKVDAQRGVLLSGAASHAGGGVASYAWDFNGDGSTDATCGADAPAAYHVFPAGSAANVKLTVTSPAGAAATTTQSVALPKVPAAAKQSASATFASTPATLCLTQQTDAASDLPSTADCVREIFLLNTVAVRSRSASCFTIRNYTSADYLKMLQQRSAGPRIAASTLTAEQIRQLAFMKYAPFVKASITGPVEINGIPIPIPPGVPTSYDSGDGQKDGEFTIGRRYPLSVPLLGQVADLGELDLSHSWKFTDGITHVADVNTNQLRLGGLPFEAKASLDFVRGYKSRLSFQVKLPNVFESGDGEPVSFKLTLTGDNHGSWAVERADGRIPNLHLGTALVKDLYLKYQQADDSWEGGLKLFVSGEEDGYSLDLRAPEEGGSGGPGSGLGLRGGDLSHLGGDFDFGDDEVQIYAGVFLRKVRLAAATHPLVLSGGVTLHIVKVFFVDGDGAMVFATPREPYTWPHQVNVGMDRLAGTTFTTWAFVSGGNLYLDKGGRRWNLGGGYILVKPGLVATGSRDKIDLFGVFSVEGGFNGEVNTRTGAFNLGGTMRVCAGDVLCDSAETLISSVGIAGCKEVPPFGFSVGGGYVWGGSAEVFLADCDLGRYRASIARAAQGEGSSRSFTIAAGSPGAQLELTGADAPPRLAVTGPHGERFSVGDAPRQITKDHAALRVAANRTTYVALRHPAAGRWTVTSEGGERITAARMRDVLPAPALSARVSGTGAHRTLAYHLTGAPGRRVTFHERSASGLRQLGPARSASGTLRFTPAVATSSAREVDAVISQDGLPVRKLVVARFSYRTPRPARPARARATRGRRTLTVSWQASPGAARYAVSVRTPSGRRLLAETRARRVVFRDVEYYLRGSVRITPVRRDGVSGPSAAARFRAWRPG